MYASNSDEKLTNEWSANLKIAFNGVVGNASVEAGAKEKETYRKFSSEMQKFINCSGGDKDLRGTLNSDVGTDAVAEPFKKWIKTADSNPDVMAFGLMDIWTLIGTLDDAKLADYSMELEKAFRYIVNNPKRHKTKARFVISSDWGELGLLSPDAFIIEDPEHPPAADLKDQLIFNSTKIQWGKEHSYKYKRDVTIE